jgi:hypothetical protein
VDENSGGHRGSNSLGYYWYTSCLVHKITEN